MLAILKENGQDFNGVTTTNGWTALHLAAEGGHLDAVQYLLANGAKQWTKIKTGRREGYTAKQAAELEKKTEVATIL